MAPFAVIGNPSFEASAAQLDAARRDWLSGLAMTHRRAPDADSALALAQGEWLCGEYDDALGHFVEAAARAPGSAAAQLGLVRAASSLGLDELETETLARARQRLPHDPDLCLHAARTRVPDDMAAARAILDEQRGLPLIDQFAHALAAVAGEAAPEEDNPADPPEHRARNDSLRWVLRHAPPRSTHTGMPARVLLRPLAAAPGSGLTLECGVYFGRSLRLIARASEGFVHGFDSFEGLPEAWNPREGAGAYSTGGRLPRVDDNVVLHRGWFEDTLPPFFAQTSDPIRLLHVDCDLHSSTRTVLAAAAERLVAGSIVVFDDLIGYPGYEAHTNCARFEEFVADARAALGTGRGLPSRARSGNPHPRELKCPAQRRRIFCNAELAQRYRLDGGRLKPPSKLGATTTRRQCVAVRNQRARM